MPRSYRAMDPASNGRRSHRMTHAVRAPFPGIFAPPLAWASRLPDLDVMAYLPPVGATHEASRPSSPGRMSTPQADPANPQSGDDADATLVAAMARGDESAASRLYDRFGAIVFGLALRITGDQADAEDVVIDTFAQAWRDASRFARDKGSVSAWIAVLARSRALDHVRSRQRRAKATERAGVDSEGTVGMGQEPASADRHTEDVERSSAVAKAMATLPTPQRRAIELAFFEGLTHPEVADRLQEPLGTVKTRIRLGLHKLRDTLDTFSPRAGEASP